MMVSEIIQKAAPAGAKFYRLQIKFTDGTSKLYPDEKGFYTVGEAPASAPPGRYSVCFHDPAGNLISQQDNPPIELGLESSRGGTTQLGMSLLNTGATRPALAANVTERRATEATEAEKPAGKPQAVQPPSSEADLEIQRYQYALDLEERQQEFIKNSTYVTEVGELFTLNRIMRREMMEMQRVIVQQTQQAYKDLDLMKGTLRDLFKLQQEAIEKAGELIPRPPPPPPPDYVGLGNTALAVLRELGVAYINRSQGGEGGALRGKSKTPQLPSPGADAKEAVTTQPTDIIEKMIQKIKSAGEIDLAIAMSSPEKWKALMEELLPPKSEPAAAQKPAEASAKS